MRRSLLVKKNRLQIMPFEVFYIGYVFLYLRYISISRVTPSSIAKLYNSVITNNNRMKIERIRMVIKIAIFDEFRKRMFERSLSLLSKHKNIGLPTYLLWNYRVGY